jgi:excisionase family DNA binding protein
MLTTRQVAERLALSPETILRKWRAGMLPGFRLESNVLRFDADEIDAWLAERRGQAYTRPIAQLGQGEAMEGRPPTAKKAPTPHDRGRG